MSFSVVLAWTVLLLTPPQAFVLDPEPWDSGALFEYLERAARDGAVVQQAGGRYFVLNASERQQALARVMGVSGRMAGVPPGDPHAVTDFRAPGSVRGEGGVLVLDHRENAVFSAMSFLLDRSETVRWARDGAVIIDSAYSSGNTARAQNFAEQFGVRVLATDAPPAAAFEMHRPRVGVLRSGDSRWLEWVLNEYKVPFTRVESGGPAWRVRFDSLVLCGAVADAAALGAFVREGGTLVAIGAGAEAAVRGLGLDVAVRAGPMPARAEVVTSHPIAFGMPASADIFAAAPVVFQARAPSRSIVTVGSAAALLQVPLGRGNVLLFGFEPQFHGEAYNTFRLLLNALYLASAQRL